jgi:hypothetical protein
MSAYTIDMKAALDKLDSVKPAYGKEAIEKQLQELAPEIAQKLDNLHDGTRCIWPDVVAIMNKIGWQIGGANNAKKTDKLWHEFEKAFGWKRP